MPKFKEGDKVRLWPERCRHSGQEGIVTTAVGEMVYYNITKQGGGLDDAYDRNNQLGFLESAHEANLELVKPAYVLESEKVLQEPAICDSSNAVDHPQHYNQGKIEVIDAIEDWGLGFNDGNAVKYIARAKHKGKRKEDLEKALWYIKRELGYLD